MKRRILLTLTPLAALARRSRLRRRLGQRAVERRRRRREVQHAGHEERLQPGAEPGAGELQAQQAGVPGGRHAGVPADPESVVSYLVLRDAYICEARTRWASSPSSSAVDKQRQPADHAVLQGRQDEVPGRAQGAGCLRGAAPPGSRDAALPAGHLQQGHRKRQHEGHRQGDPRLLHQEQVAVPDAGDAHRAPHPGRADEEREARQYAGRRQGRLRALEGARRPARAAAAERRELRRAGQEVLAGPGLEEDAAAS